MPDTQEQHKPAPRGGARKGAGRPSAYGTRMVRRSAMMPAGMWALMEALGAGNASAGIRQLIEWHDPHWMK